MPQIVINDITPRIQYYASAGQTVFQFPWPMFYPTDIQVYKRLPYAKPDDVAQILTYVTDYTVFINPAPSVGGYITLNSGAASNDIITLARAQPDQRLNNYIDGGQFLASVVNPDFDKIVLMDQQRQMYDEVIGVHYNVNAVIEPVVDNILPVLPPDCVWVKNSANTEIVALPYSGGGGGGSTTQVVIIVTQPGHGFVVGQVVYSNAGTFALAKADNAADAEVIGMVASVIDANNFDLLVSGQVTGLAGLTPGGVYFLSDVVAGQLTLTEPTADGHISKPLLIATDTSDGFFFNFRGKIINSSAFSWVSVTADTVMQSNVGYIVDGLADINLILPALSNVGDEIEIAGYTDLSWKVVQNAGQTIHMGNLATTAGVAGYLKSTNNFDTLRMVCVTANTTWLVLSSIGNITVA